MLTPQDPLLRVVLLVTALGGLVPSARAQNSSAPAPTPSAPAKEEVIRLSPFEVNTTLDRGYQALSSVSGSRINELLRNMPSSISVMNKDLITDIAATDIFQAAQYAVGGTFENNAQNDTRFNFRGVVNQWQTRNFFIWYLPTDTFSIERTEIIRGPNALLYGDASPGGMMNIITKRALQKDSTEVAVRVSSWDSYRASLDANRTSQDKRLAVRLNAVYNHGGDWRDYRFNRNRNGHLATTYRLGQNTTLRGELEAGVIRRSTQHNALVDQFRTYDAQGSATVGGIAGISAGPRNIRLENGAIYYSQNTATGWKQSNGVDVATGVAGLFVDENWRVAAPERQFAGPAAFENRDYHQYAGFIEHRVGRRLNLELAYNVQNNQNHTLRATNAGAVRRDPNPTLPGLAAVNPGFNRYYIDQSWQDQPIKNIVRDTRFTTTYEADFGFMQQKLIGAAGIRRDHFTARTFIESLSLAQIAANTGAPVSASNNFNSNPLNRRYYIDQGSRPDLSFALLPGVSEWQNVGFTADQYNNLDYAYVAASGSYFKDKVRTMVGVRRDHWTVDSLPQARDANGVNYLTSSTRLETQNVWNTAYNYGVVWHATSFLSVFGNYSESFRPIGGAARPDGTGILPSITGKGEEYGARTEMFDKKLAMVATVFDIKQQNARSPNISTLAQNELQNVLGISPASGFTVNDTIDTSNKGWELEVVANPTPQWTMTANYSKLRQKNINTVPIMRALLAKAIATSQPPANYSNLQSYVNSISEGGGVNGTRDDQANFFTRYRFNDGALKGVYVGGGANIRGRTLVAYAAESRVGNTLVARNVQVFTPATETYNLLLGYGRKLGRFEWSVSLNVNNVTDELVLNAFGLGAGQYANPREVLLTNTIKF